jgi:hypothetical protein
MLHLTIWRLGDLANENGSARVAKDFRSFAGFGSIRSRFSKTRSSKMLKSILGVIVGYIVMAIFSFAAFTCAYLALGVDRVFEAGSYDVSTIWMVVMIVFSLIGGILGGWICAAISKSKGACTAFAVIVLVLGLIVAIMTKMKDHPDTARTGDVPNLQAMQMAQTPTWVCFLTPVLGAAGVLLGARMKKLPAA